MAAGQPTQEQIELFLSIAENELRRTAITFLRGNNNNLERAIQEYFTDKNPRRYEAKLAQGQYSESQWGAGKGEGNSWDNPPAFNFEDGQTTPPVNSLTAPSRPPSPAKRGSTLAIEHPGPNPQYDEDMARAMEASMHEVYGGGQETGVTDSSGNEIVPDPPAISRKRSPGEPAFLKPLPTHDYLPAVLTVLLSIPMFRRDLLSWAEPLPNYGSNPSWWEGEGIEFSRPSAFEEGNALPEGAGSREADVAHEIQRILAFLDGTTRSYGSAGALRALLTASGNWDPDTFVTMFKILENLEDPSRSPLFVSKSGGEFEGHPHYVFTADSFEPFEGSKPTLYDALDKRLWWGTGWTNSKQEQWLEYIAPIVIVKMDIEQSISIPEPLYADRYLTTSKDTMEGCWNKISAREKEVKELDAEIKAHSTFATDSGKDVNTRELLKLTSAHIKGNIDPDTETADETESPDADSRLRYEKLLEQLETVSSRIDSQIKALEEARLAILQDIRRLSETLTHANVTQDQEKPTHRYRLRGCATDVRSRSPIMYLPAHEIGETDLISFDNEITSQPGWWKINYDYSGTAATVVKSLVSQAEVISAAGDSLSEVLLIYASDSALDAESDLRGLPESLEAFVKHDNESFKTEFETQAIPIDGRPIDRPSPLQIDTRVQPGGEALLLEASNPGSKPPEYSVNNIQDDDMIDLTDAIDETEENKLEPISARPAPSVTSDSPARQVSVDNAMDVDDGWTKVPPKDGD